MFGFLQRMFICPELSQAVILVSVLTLLGSEVGSGEGSDLGTAQVEPQTSSGR